MKIPEFENRTHLSPCTGKNLPIFTEGISWNKIKQIIGSNEFRSTYIIESREGQYVKDYLVGSLREGSTVMQKRDEVEEAFRQGWTVKTEGVEFWNSQILQQALDLHPAYRPTIHLYVAPQTGSVSFGRHTDSEHVVVVGVQGEKTFILDGYDPVVLTAGDWIYIPKGHPHEAVSNSTSAILSVGFHPWGSDTPSYFI